MKVQAKSAARLGSYDHHVTGALSLPTRRILALRVLPEPLHQLVLLFGVLEEEVAGGLGFSGICSCNRHLCIYHGGFEFPTTYTIRIETSLQI
jgi:hypothetical protein